MLVKIAIVILLSWLAVVQRESSVISSLAFAWQRRDVVVSITVISLAVATAKVIVVVVSPN